MNVTKRTIGNSNLKTAPLAFGGNVFGWTVNEKMAFDLLDGFVENGFNLIDTADIYSVWVPGHQGGESETIIGKWLKKSGKRDKVLIATKVGMKMSEEKKGLSKSYIFQAIEDSLKRLQTDHIDIYQSHEDDSTTPLEETLEAYTELYQQGKIKIIGASNYSAERLSQALEVSKKNNFISYQCLQPLYNLYDRSDYEAQLESVCTKFNLGVLTYFSLASGFLTGKYQSEQDLLNSSRKEIVEKYMNESGFKIINALKQVAKELNTTPGNVAIAWLMAHPSVTAPIVSATNLDQLKNLIDAAQLKLHANHIQLLNAASA